MRLKDFLFHCRKVYCTGAVLCQHQLTQKLKLQLNILVMYMYSDLLTPPQVPALQHPSFLPEAL